MKQALKLNLNGNIKKIIKEIKNIFFAYENKKDGILNILSETNFHRHPTMA